MTEEPRRVDLAAIPRAERRSDQSDIWYLLHGLDGEQLAKDKDIGSLETRIHDTLQHPALGARGCSTDRLQGSHTSGISVHRVLLISSDSADRERVVVRA